MPQFNVDFSEAVEIQLIPVGWYHVRIEKAEPKSASTGNPIVSVLLRVVGGEYDQQPLFHNWPMSGDGAGITKGALRIFLSDDAAETRTSFSTDELIGAEAMARVVHKVWAEERGGDGERRNNITQYKQLEYGEGESGIEGLFTA